MRRKSEGRRFNSVVNFRTEQGERQPLGTKTEAQITARHS
jgi:hypothetical protein